MSQQGHRFALWCILEVKISFSPTVADLKASDRKIRPRRGEEQRGVAGDLPANRSTLPQPPRGRNACYGVLREGLRD